MTYGDFEVEVMRKPMSHHTDRFHRTFEGTKQILGVHSGEPAERFGLLIEAAWDLGVIGAETDELSETVNDYFDTATIEGQQIQKLFYAMYERSVEVHSREREAKMTQSNDTSPAPAEKMPVTPPFMEEAVIFMKNAANGGFSISFESQTDKAGREEAIGCVVPTHEEIATTALFGLLSRAYLAGRADQVLDIMGTSTPRTVKARELPGVLDAARIYATDEETLDLAAEKQNALELFKDLRGVLSPVAVIIEIADETIACRIDEALNGHAAEMTLHVISKVGGALKAYPLIAEFGTGTTVEQVKEGEQ